MLELGRAAARAGLEDPLRRLAAVAHAHREIDEVLVMLTGVQTRLRDAGALPPAQDDIALERLVLLRAARAALPRVPAQPVDAGVQRLTYEEFTTFAQPRARQRPLFRLGTASFRAACELVAMVRFPAGQYHWDVTGLSRRMLLDVPARDLPRTLTSLAFRMRGFAPAFFPHVNAWRRNPFVWLEVESNRSFHRMARALARQPQVRGVVTRAWLHDPALPTVSPHLAWVNRVIEENGGLVVANGSAADDPNVRENNASREAAVEAGRYQPRYGLVLWPRAAMLAWAARHPEFDD